jgi:plastocyanin
MQHAVHNRATIRVADRTDVSGRATADEVSLDRIHNRIRKVCAFVAATLIPSSLRWMLLLTVLIVPQALWGAASAPATPQPTPGQTWFATVGAQSNDKGRQALAFLPNEIWIHAGDSITWTFDVDEIHTVTFIPDNDTRPPFSPVIPPGFSNTATFDGSKTVTTPALAKGVPPVTFTVTFPNAENFKLVCLVHENMTGVVHVLDAEAQLPHNQDFYDRQAADQRRDLLSDRDGGLVAACQRHGECAANDSLKVRVVTAGIGEISATAGGTQTLSVLRFIADQVDIRAGDTVEWTNQDPVTPHTVTFGTEPMGLALFVPSAIPPATIGVDTDGALHAVINSPGESVNSGLIRAAFQDQMGKPQTDLGVTRFRVTFKSVGAFPYICGLHDTLGMKGMVMVFP